jgi:uncharacterized membrane protein
MLSFKKIAICLLLLIGLFFGRYSLAQSEQSSSQANTFKAEVIEIISTDNKLREDGSSFEQQDLRLRAISGQLKGQEVIYYGVSDIEVANANIYQIGDEVFVDSYVDETGQTVYYVVDFVRSGPLIWLTIIFVLIVLLIGRIKGLRALLGLLISFFIIIKLMLPPILAGGNPLVISLVGGVIILTCIIYLSEGFRRKSHIAILSVLLSLAVTAILSVIFTIMTRLSGMAQEESSFLIGATATAINFRGLLLAGFIIGTIGVLDDIIIGQIEAVEQIKEINPALPAKKVFHSAYKVGNAHLGAIINTLFLTYVSTSLPLLLLFIINADQASPARLFNMEIISTEIVRTLVGSIGVILSMPIATGLASFWPANSRRHP